MTARIGLPPDALGFKVLGSDGIWSPVTGTQQIENLVTNPSFESVQPGSTVLRTNYFKDPSAADVTGNLGNIGGTPASIIAEVATDNAHQGATAYKISVTSDGKFGRVPITVSNSMLVKAGGKFVWSYWIYSTRSGTINPHWEGTKASDSAYTGGSGGPAVTISANTWTKITGIYTATIDVYVARAGGYNMDVYSGDTIWLDEFLIEKSDTLGEFFFGDTTDSLGWDYAWSGTPESSTSVAKASSVTVHTNNTPGLGAWTLSGDATYANGEISLNSGAAWAESPFIPVNTVGDTHGEFIVDYFTDTASTSFTPSGGYHFSSYYYDANGAAIANTLGYTTNGRAVAVPVGQWTGRDYTSPTKWLVELGPGIAFVRFRIMLSTYAAPIVKIRKPSFTSGPGSAATSLNRFEYFDGSTSAKGDFSYAWTGAVDASASIQQAPAVAGYGVNYSGRTSWQSSEWPTSGKSITVLAGVPNTDTFATMPSPFPYGTSLAGRTFTFIGTIKTTETIPAVRDGRWWAFNWVANRPSGAAHSVIIRNNATTAGTHEVRGTFTFPTDVTTSAFLRLYNGSSTPGNIVWWDNVVIIEGTYTGPYFDGNTLPDVDYIYRWSGTPHASTSIGT